MLSDSDLSTINKNTQEIVTKATNEIVGALTKLVTRTAGTLRNNLVSNVKFEKRIKSLPTKDDVEQIIDRKLGERLKHLPTKVEFNSKMNKLFDEVKIVRESQEIHTASHSEINDRLDKFEKAFNAS